jgi:hypothetical protein
MYVGVLYVEELISCTTKKVLSRFSLFPVEPVFGTVIVQDVAGGAPITQK